MTKNVYNIPAGIPFARSLAAELLHKTENSRETLPQYRIFLPTRRACSILRDTFLELSAGKPLLLPRLQPLGDIDEEELSLSMSGAKELTLDIPPPMPPLRRQMLLAKLIELLPDHNNGGFDRALALAGALGQLMDQIYTESLDLGNLAALVPAEFAAHWQITVDFLKILSEAWPAILAEEGRIDAADRRNRLMRGLSALWQQLPPPYPVIAAGSTGSIPATAELLNTVAVMQNGSVILPGLDTQIDEESWAALEESHPQFGLKNLLQYMKIDRKDVRALPSISCNSLHPRLLLATEMMRPAATSASWTSLTTNSEMQQTFKKGLQKLDFIECDNEHEEAESISVLLRSVLEEPGKTAALVTPDRNLARRVTAACRRWNIVLDDSAGQTLDQTRQGIFLRLCMQAVLEEFAPVSLLGLLKHEMSCCGLTSAEFIKGVEDLERNIRGLRPAPGLSGLEVKIHASEHSSKVNAAEFLKRIAPSLSGFREGSALEKSYNFNILMKMHLQMAEAVASVHGESPADSGAAKLWQGEAGEAAARLFADITDHAMLVPDITLQTYNEIITTLMRAVTVRPSYGTHPRLRILGQLEARLQDADLVILAGLNEGTWPAESAHDPWMSRPMRAEFGLPGSARSIGLAAHDFVQGFCASEVVITRARRSGGTPTVPSRWLQRLDTVLEAVNVLKPEYHPAARFARVLDKASEIVPFQRPAPRPPGAQRPQELSATRVEELLRDPYSTYARYVLRLRKLDPLEKQPDAAERGKLLHRILKRFNQEYPKALPDNAAEILVGIAAQELQDMHEDPSEWNFWRLRFARMAEWFVQHEQEWRTTSLPVLMEEEGFAAMDFATPFTLKATPDRIDNGPDGARVIDYKSGGDYPKKSISNGRKPQLALEALILARGGFKELGPLKTISLSYWLLTGSAEPAKVVQIDSGIEDILQRTKEGLKALIETFADPQTPYYSLPRPERAPDYTDYEHLARVREWAVLDDTETEAA